MTLKKIRYLIDQKDAALLYKSYILPYFDLGNLWYHSACVHHKRTLQVLQNKCIKIIIGKKNYHDSNTAHRELSLLKLDDRVKISQLKFAHRMSRKPGNLEPHSSRALRSNRNYAKKPTSTKCQIWKRFYSNKYQGMEYIKWRHQRYQKYPQIQDPHCLWNETMQT